MTVDVQDNAPATTTEPRPIYWSIRRELWENRSLYVAPLIVAAMVMFALLIHFLTLPQRMRALAAMDAEKQRAAVSMPFNMMAGLVVVTAFIVGFFYCLDALHGERRDRSILFWKSLPVSDRDTVLSKAAIPLVVMPLFILVIIVVAQTIMMMFSTAVLLGSGTTLRPLWTHAQLVHSTIGLVYALIAMSLWHAPLYAWLLLVSGWAKRATFLWAVMPPLLIAAFEKITFRTSYLGELLKDRVVGWFMHGFAVQRGHVALDPLDSLTPGSLLSAPGLWIGLILAAGFLAAAVRLRRNREPI
jgi:ABC-2 type transport system permease protein